MGLLAFLFSPILIPAMAINFVVSLPTAIVFNGIELIKKIVEAVF